MSIEVIEEYLSVAEYCVTTQKSKGGLHGYPALVLLFSVIDALSNYAGHPEHSFGELQFIFRKLTGDQIKNLRNWYRNLPAHQAIIMPGTQLSAEPGQAIEFGPSGEPTHIRVIGFYEAVKNWWTSFDKSSINPKFEQAQAPKNPIVPTMASSLHASGAYIK